MNGGVLHILLEFAFFYPLVMSLLWMTGGVIYFLRWERNEPLRVRPPELPEYPMVTLVVPCHNEGEQVRETIAHLASQQYPNFEIIAINDGSTDDTGAQLDQLLDQYPKLRVIHMSSNQGKAMGLRAAALASNADFLVCVDGDALLDDYATHWLLSHMLDSPRVAAVTGNPRIRNRSTLLGKLQVGEFSSIIGLIKRAQRVYGRIFTVSGVIAAFRKSALHDVGYWNTDMVTEDIDVSWRLQMRHWEIRYEPNALCWILMPETIRGLWKQRLRWAQGGSEVLLRYTTKLFAWRQRRMWPVAMEYVMSLVWSYTMAIIVALWVLGLFIELPRSLYIETLLPQWHGVVLGAICLLQFLISLLVDRRYETRIGRNYYWMIWYPLVYWILNTATSIVAMPKALMKRKGTRAVWVSPDRGAMKAEAILIQRPERQSSVQKAMFSVITVIAWLFWAFLWLPLITLGAWAFGARNAWLQLYVQQPSHKEGDLNVVLLAAIICALIFTTWSGYNRARFSGRQKRRGNNPVGVEATARVIGASTDDAVSIQSHRRAVVSVSDAGYMTVDEAR